MNKYELTVVVNAMTEDDVRTAVIEKVKDLVAKCGGTSQLLMKPARRN